jgi:lysozyme
MKASQKGIDFIKSFEGCKLTAYKDSAGIPTVGYGTIQYPDGTPVKMGDVISSQRAKDLLAHEVALKTVGVQAAIKGLTLTQNQVDALISFAYNCGIRALQLSTLLKKVKANPNDPTIRAEFMKWNKARNPKTKKLEPVPGLTRRRAAEADLYFYKTN